MRKRFWIEAVVGGCSSLLFVATLLWPDWLELIFGVDPDHGDGSAEWLIVAVTAVVAVMSSLMARVEWRRARLGGATGGATFDV